jgi:mannitol/fructose-specific phosphotransferase system IIA component (Ntr-type)
MNLGDILTPGQIIPDLAAADRWEAIDEMVGRLVHAGKVRAEDREVITAAVKKREASMSTGIGFGIGIPHASTDLVGELTAVFARSRKGVQFDALDSQPVHLVTLLLVPQGQFQKHLHTLAGIAKVQRRDEFLRALDAAPDAESILKVVREHSALR